MAETVHITIPDDDWINLSAAAGLNGRVSNSGNSTLVYVQAIDKPDADITAGHRIDDDRIFDYVVEGTEGLWMRALHNPGIASVTPDLAVGVFSDSLNVHINEVHNDVVNELFHLHTGTTSTIAVASNAGDTSIELADATGFNQFDAIQINNGNIETTFPIISLAPVGNVLTLDRPLDFAYDIGDIVEVVHTDLSTTAGTLASPVIHVLQPEPGKIWLINRIIMAMTHATAAADSTFGDLSALANGVVLRVNIGGQFFSLTNWKINEDIKLDMFDVVYSDKAGPSLFGTSARGTFNRIGAIIKLDGDAGDFMDVLVQDDLTALASYFINGQGYIEDTPQ